MFKIGQLWLSENVLTLNIVSKMNLITINWPGGSTSFPVEKNTTVLDRALKSGLLLNFSCRRGDCGQCIAKIVESQDPSFISGTLKELCQIEAIYPSVFEISFNPSDNIDISRTFPAKVRSINSVANNVSLLRLYLPPNSKFTFEGGQFADLIVSKDLERSYSISNFHLEFLEVDFYIKRISGGKFSNWLNNAHAGELIKIRAPRGNFLLNKNYFDRSFFLATGTGIVPIFAMLKMASTEQLKCAGKIHIIW